MKKPVVITLLIVALLLVAAGIGATLWFTIGQGGFSFDQNDVSASAEESKTINVNGAVNLKVQDDAGNVTVIGGEGKRVIVNVVKTGYAPTQSDADKNLKNIKYEIKQNGNVITITYDLGNVNANHVDTIDFVITVPSETTVNVDANLGEVDISGIIGKVSIKSDFGDITAENLEGALFAETKSGGVEAASINAGSADIELITGFGNIHLEKADAKNITLTSGSGQVEMKDVRATGKVEMDSNFGNINYENGSAESLNVDTESGKVNLIKLNVRGSLTVTDGFGEIDLAQVSAGSYDLKTGSGSITVDGAKNKVKAYTDFGNIAIKNAQSVMLELKSGSGSIEFEGTLGDGPHNVKSDYGEISLTLPGSSKLSVDLQTDFGKIHSDIPITATFTGDVENSRLIGTMNGGSDQLNVKTGSGGINISAGK